MPVNVVMPHMGESVVEGTVTAWLKKPGDRVERDESIAEIETEKINVEIPAPQAGVLLEVLVEEGATVQVEETLAVIGESGEAPVPAPAVERPTPPPSPAPPVEKQPVVAAPKPAVEKPALAAPSIPVPPTPPARLGPPPAPGQPAPPPRHTDDVAPTEGPVTVGTLGVLASPAVRRFARQMGVDLGNVSGTGRMGRITKDDVQSYVNGLAAQEEAEPAAPEEPETSPEGRPDVDEELVPLTAMRRAIAEHMVRSKQEAPHVTTVAEVDVSDVDGLRRRHKEQYAANGVKLTYMPFILHAVSHALKEYPDLNASWTDEGILVRYRINLGIAVAIEDGLVVPVIRDTDRLSLPELALAIQEVAEKTRQGKVTPADLAGGTFTITNPGVFGAVISTPIIHQPQAAILATGRVADVPAVIDGQIVPRKRMFLSLSYDHRVVDGATAVQFLQRVRRFLEAAEFEVG